MCHSALPPPPPPPPPNSRWLSGDWTQSHSRGLPLKVFADSLPTLAGLPHYA